LNPENPDSDNYVYRKKSIFDFYRLNTTRMLKEERQAFIIKQINLHNKVLSSDLSLKLNVSEDTVRRDLNELAESGQILKVHGGALSKSFHYPFSQSEVYAKESKKEIARKVIDLLKDGMSILVGGGTTMIEVARMIPDTLRCTFFTVSPLVALELAERPNISVILLGGQLSKNSHIMIGAQVVNQLSEIKVDLCILGTNSLSVEDGLTDSDWEVVQVKKAMIRSAKKTAIMSIAEKLGSDQNMKVCDLNSIHYLVTDLNPNDASLREYAAVVEVVQNDKQNKKRGPLSEWASLFYLMKLAFYKHASSRYTIDS
jgi:DeoR/GlpR family transcriptional regulator of sugar metabolism